MDELRCPDCGAEMEEGFLPDLSMSGIRQTKWHRGKPKKTLLGTKYYESEAASITAYRCTECGILRLYALDSEN